MLYPDIMAKKSWFILLTFIFLLGLVSATISNVRTEPSYPNPSPTLIKVYADVSDASNATLYYRINENTYSNPFFISRGFAWLPPYEDVSDNVQVFYWIEVTNLSGEKESTTEFNFTYDGSPPVISIIGENPLTIEINSTYDELRATASDSVYGDLTSSIVISGSVDTTVLGQHFINYTVSDPAGNNATVMRIVNVVEPAPVISGNTGGGSGGGDRGEGYSFNSPIVIINGTTSNASTEKETDANNNLQNNPETNSKTTVTGKSVMGFLGGNRAAGIIIVVLIIGAIVGYGFIKRRIKRKLYGKMEGGKLRRFIDSLKHKKKRRVSEF
jgi:hypothetical protein